MVCFVRYNNNNPSVFSEPQLELGSARTDYEAYQGTTLTIPLGSTVYGATVDVLTGEMRVTHAYADLGDYTWINDEGGLWRVNMSLLPSAEIGKFLGTGACSTYKWVQVSSATSVGNNEVSITNSAVLPLLRVRDNANLTGKTADQTQAFLTGVKIVYELATPLTVSLSPSQLQTLLGQNNIWADTGDVENVTYRADTRLFIEKLTKPTEDDMIANTNIASGKFFMVGNNLYFSTASIASGDAIIVGTNCTALSLADALNNINA